MSAEARLEELRARVSLARGATLLLAVVANDAALDESRRLLCDLLRAAPLSVVDLGAQGYESGPGRWAELTRGAAADAFVLSAAPKGPLSVSAFTRLLNAERELLRGLAGPTVLVVSAQTEKALRQGAPDFFTWLAQTYALPEPEALSSSAQKLGAAPAAAAADAPAEEPIRFLHLSDVHLRPDRVKRYDQDRVLGGLVEFLRRDRESFPLDLVFITGDLAQSGRADEYALVADLLRELLDATGVPPERTFAVPGNHDVDRGVGRWLLRTLSRDEESIAFFEDEQSRAFHAQKFEAYGKALRGALGDGRPLGLGVGEGAVETVEVRGAKVAVASLNSAWFCQGDDDQGKLWLGEANVDRAAQRVHDEGAAFAVALMHHPFDYLHEDERENVERYLERGFDLVLRGHLHKDKARAVLSARGGFVEVAAPAAYQGSQWPNGCFLGEIRPRQRTVRLRPYAYASGADPWVLDTKVFPDDAHDGHCHTYPVAEKRRWAGSFTRHLQRAAREALRSAGPEVQREIASQIGLAAPSAGASVEHWRPITRYASSLVDDPAFWWIVRANPSANALAHAVRDWSAKTFSKRRITTSDPHFLEHALWEVAQGFTELTKGERSVRRFLYQLPEEHLGSVLHGLLISVLDGPVSDDPFSSKIVVGTDGEPATRRAVIGVRKTTLSFKHMWVKKGLAWLDQQLDASGGAYGALVLLGDSQPRKKPTQLEHVKTPAGRDVLLLHL
ncbi:MAG TPA: metallophosphoesterase [Polyangiaceae bacterium]|nr:metallophosphoesterase [Polyangiaceae bacterium]